MIKVGGTSAVRWQNELMASYNVGKNTEYLRIRSAYDKGREQNRSRLVQKAFSYPYIAPNSNFNISWLVFDIDREFNLFTDIYDRNLPVPNLIVTNPENGHAHLWYVLKTPVYCQDAFKHSKAYLYEEAVYKALCRALGADPHFNRTLCKTPFHSEWVTYDAAENPYNLSDLCSHLDMNWKEQPTKKVMKGKTKKVKLEQLETFPGAEKGSRHNELFDFVRFHAYKARSQNECATEEELSGWCTDYVIKSNDNNDIPLTKKECIILGDSIAKWTWANIEPANKAKSKYDDNARALSLKVRQAKAEKKLKKIAREIKKHPEASNRELSRILGEGFSTDTVNRAVKEIKARKQAATEKSKASAELVVGLVPPDSVVERFVNEVARPIGLSFSG